MEPICSHCNKSLYTALREGCSSYPCESRCEPFSRDFGEPMQDPYEFPKDDERASVPLSERFNVVFTGFDWWVVDRMEGWRRMGTKKAAYEKAADLNYQWEAMI